MRQARRQSNTGGAYEGLTKLTKGGPVWTGDIRLVPELLEEPGRWKQPRRIFVNSMSDLFHEAVPDKFIADVFFRMALNQRHTFQILTKRPRRMLQWMCGFDANQGIDSVRYGEAEDQPELERNWPWPLPNVWLGVSVEDQAAADERIPLLMQTPAAVRWISAEPLLGPIDLRKFPLPPDNKLRHAWRLLDWVVAGGESGSGARPMHPDWARQLRDQCAEFAIPFFFKQWGAWAPFTYVAADTGRKLVRLGMSKHEQRREIVIGGAADGTEPFNMRRGGKKDNGRLLDGRTHDEYPR